MPRKAAKSTRKAAQSPKKEVQTRRRRRQPNTGEGTRLAAKIPEADRKKYMYRWINNTGTRIYRLTKEDDYELVSRDYEAVEYDEENNTDLGNAISEYVGPGPDGPIRAYLCRKPLKYYEEDKKAEQEDLDEQLERLRQGFSSKGEANAEYIPHSGISIAR